MQFPYTFRALSEATELVVPLLPSADRHKRSRLLAAAPAAVAVGTRVFCRRRARLSAWHPPTPPALVRVALYHTGTAV